MSKRTYVWEQLINLGKARLELGKYIKTLEVARTDDPVIRDISSQICKYESIIFRIADQLANGEIK